MTMPSTNLMLYSKKEKLGKWQTIIATDGPHRYKICLALLPTLWILQGHQSNTSKVQLLSVDINENSCT